MKSTKISSLSVVSITWIAVLLSSSVSAQAVLYYNADQLVSYARLTSQLRKEIADTIYELQMRIATLSTKPVDAMTAISEIIADVTSFTSDYWDGVYNIGTRLKLNLATAMKVQAPDPSTDAQAPIFGLVTLDHGLGFNTDQGAVVISRSGIYLMEFKAQGIDFNGISTRINVYGADGSSKYNFVLFTDWEVIPYVYCLKLEAGDRFEIGSFSSSNGGSPGRLFAAAAANQLSLRYLGQFVPLDVLTTAAPVLLTTPWWLSQGR